MLSNLPMVDYVKLEIQDAKLAASLKGNNKLEFFTKRSDDTGEAFELKKVALYKNLKFTIHPTNRIFITGSLHIFYNMIMESRKHNYDRFTYDKLKFVIEYLSLNFELNPELIAIRNIEFGFNIMLDRNLNVNDIIKRFTTYKYRPFSEMKLHGKGFGIECAFSQYSLKIYNKGLQHNLDINILRFEKRITTMQTQFPNGLYLVDLINKQTWKSFKKGITDALNDCLFIEEVDVVNLKKEEKTLYLMCSNPLFWGKQVRRMKTYYRNRFKKFMEKYKANTFFNKLNCLFEDEYYRLF